MVVRANIGNIFFSNPEYTFHLTKSIDAWHPTDKIFEFLTFCSCVWQLIQIYADKNFSLWGRYEFQTKGIFNKLIIQLKILIMILVFRKPGGFIEIISEHDAHFNFTISNKIKEQVHHFNITIKILSSHLCPFDFTQKIQFLFFGL